MAAASASTQTAPSGRALGAAVAKVSSKAEMGLMVSDRIQVSVCVNELCIIV